MEPRAHSLEPSIHRAKHDGASAIEAPVRRRRPATHGEMLGNASAARTT